MEDRHNTHRHTRRAFTLAELIAAVTIIGVLAALIVPRIAGHAADGDVAACHANLGEIEIQVRLWRRAMGDFPAANLNDIGGDTEYFPDGLPVCPVDGTPYTIDAAGRVVGHSH